MKDAEKVRTEAQEDSLRLRTDLVNMTGTFPLNIDGYHWPVVSGHLYEGEALAGIMDSDIVVICGAAERDGLSSRLTEALAKLEEYDRTSGHVMEELAQVKEAKKHLEETAARQVRRPMAAGTVNPRMMTCAALASSRVFPPLWQLSAVVWCVFAGRAGANAKLRTDVHQGIGSDL